ncbi:MAG: polyhydroxyalkanoate synthesis repressor PhaR [Azospirillaceae bacterium]
MARSSATGSTREAAGEEAAREPIKIKKYANRRLYNTATSSYVTLDHLCRMVKDGEEFVVVDAKSGEDLTRSVLTQIIVEEEAKGENLLPINFLRQLIGLYGSNMELLVPNYLEYSMRAFAENQDRLSDYFQSTMGGIFPFSALEQMGKQNMAMFEKAMQMFTPFAPPAAASDPKPGPESGEDDLKTLQERLDHLQAQLRAMKGQG